MVTLSSLLSTMPPVTLNLPPPSSSTPSYRLNNVAADMEAFLGGIMDDSALSDGLMDDEYYLFAGEGYDADGTDIDEPMDSSETGPIDIDPFHYVYSNIPDSTHILKHAANCDHCRAKKFQFEMNGFFCRNGK
uniref:Uncharacterized protein n=1 Tax=Hordeum vulgare subsp. vulgare TaxID=112509 RepID=A0A8I6XC60_HORVV